MAGEQVARVRSRSPATRGGRRAHAPHRAERAPGAVPSAAHRGRASDSMRSSGGGIRRPLRTNLDPTMIDPFVRFYLLVAWYAATWIPLP